MQSTSSDGKLWYYAVDNGQRGYLVASQSDTSPIIEPKDGAMVLVEQGGVVSFRPFSQTNWRPFVERLSLTPAAMAAISYAAVQAASRFTGSQVFRREFAQWDDTKRLAFTKHGPAGIDPSESGTLADKLWKAIIAALEQHG